MNYKVIVSGLILTLVLGGLAVWGISGKQETSPQVKIGSSGRLTAAEMEYDFGTISMAKGKVKKTYAVKNADSIPATVTKLYTSCMCTKASLVRPGRKAGPYGMPGHGAIPKIAEEIGAGEEATVEVEFDPAAHGPAGVGRVERMVTLELNGQPPINLKFTATVTP